MTSETRLRHDLSVLVIRPCSLRGGQAAFTIIELIVVIGIVFLLAGLVLSTSSYVHNEGARSRAAAEIAAISAALENYQADNGVYVPAPTLDARAVGNNLSNYSAASLTLYENLTGDFDHDRNSDSGKTAYISFRPNELSPASGDVAYVKDPFGNSYGYSTANAADPIKGYNPTFDLWSTGGLVTGSDQTQWIKNW